MEFGVLVRYGLYIPVVYLSSAKYSYFPSQCPTSYDGDSWSCCSKHMAIALQVLSVLE